MRPDLTQTEVLLLRQLITDRMENRFRTAEKASAEMNLKTLRGCADEIDRLESLKEKLKDDGA